MPLTQKRAQELLEVLDQARNGIFKDRKNDLPIHRVGTQTQPSQTKTPTPTPIRARRRRSHKPRRRKTATPLKLDLEKKVNLFLFARLPPNPTETWKKPWSCSSRSSDSTSATNTSNASTATPKSSWPFTTSLFFCSRTKEQQAIFLAMGQATRKVDSHYASYPKKYGKKYVHFFSMIDLGTGMYVGCGTSRILSGTPF